MKVLSFAFRVNKGPSGGPGGSNDLLDKSFSNNDPDFDIKFIFKKKMSKKKSRIEFLFRVLLSKADVYIAHDMFSAMALIILGKRKVIMSYHNQGSLIYEKRGFSKSIGKFEELFLKFQERFIVKFSALWMFTSYGSKNTFLRTCSLTQSDKEKLNKKSKIVYNSCWSFLSEKDMRFNEIYSKCKGRQVYLSVTALTELKGVDQIPDFISSLKGFKEKAVWILIGGGPLEEVIYKKIDELGLDHCFIHIRERISQELLASYQELADVYLMLHRTSIFDLATLEVMSKGTALLLSDIGGNKEFNVNENVVFPHEIDSIFKDDELIGLKEKNEAAFYEFFSNKILVEGYKETINEVIK